jgi:hypothetical protein
MSTTHATPRTPGAVLLDVVRRIWSLGIIVLVGYLSYLALEYLVVTLMFPTETPDEITGVPLRLTEDVLSSTRDEWAGVAAVENARSPIAHYHRIDGWIQPDLVNTCTQSGCHSPLPHAKRKEVRAFLNMHSTSLHCGVCHMTSESPTLATTWYDLTDGRPQEAPAVLRLYAWVTSDEGQAAADAPTRDLQDRLVSDLRHAARQADDDPGLARLAEHLAAVRFDSPAFVQLLERLPTALERKFRGEYDTKLALRNASGEPILGHPNSAAAVNTYLAQAESLSGDARDAALADVHTARRSAPRQCRDCHVSSGGVLDFAGAGYPPARIDALTRPMIFRMIANIAEGQPFYMPNFIGDAEPTAPPTPAAEQ